MKLAPNKMRSDNHPVSILYRLRRKTRIWLEHRFPGAMFSDSIIVVGGVYSYSEIAIRDRLDQFVAHTPYTNREIKGVLTQGDRYSIIKLADRILLHKYELLGCNIDFNKQANDWHLDYATGYRWDPTRLYCDHRGATPAGSDIKRPWEFSRSHHFIPLGIAYLISGDKKYAVEFINQVTDWIDKNAYGYGVNWACPMDVAIRAVNWLFAYSIMEHAFTDPRYLPFKRAFTHSLWNAAKFIANHLEWNGPFSERRANHFLANLTGLLTLGIFFKDTYLGKRWLDFSKKWLEREIERQVLADGVHFECSISYHRLCLEMFTWCYYLGVKSDVKFSDRYCLKLQNMRRFSYAYTRPDGVAPLIGDNDDGRLICTGINPIDDHRYLWGACENGASGLGALLFAGKDRPHLKRFSGLLSCGYSGFYILSHDELFLLFRAGRLAHAGTHAHNDQLSFELCIKDVPVFVDRGTYAYTSDPQMRSYFRSTKAHNLVSINGEEQNRPTGLVFGFKDDTQTDVIKANEKTLVGRHTGFKSLGRKNISHTRSLQVSHNNKGLTIIDTIDGLRFGDNLKWYFHLSPGLTIEMKENAITISHHTGSICQLEKPADTDFRIESGYHSPSYGRLEKADSLVISKRIPEGQSRCSTTYRIIWK